MRRSPKIREILKTPGICAGRARLRPIRLRPAGLFELGPFDLGQIDLGQFDLGQSGFFSIQAKKNLLEILFDLGQFFRLWTIQELKKNRKCERKQHIMKNTEKTTKKKNMGGRNKQHSPCFLVKTSPADGRRRFHKNTAYAPFRE